MSANSTVPPLGGIGTYGKAIIRLLPPPPPPLVPYNLKNTLEGFYDDLDQRWERILSPQPAGERSEAQLRALSQAKISLQLPTSGAAPKEARPYFLIIPPGGKTECRLPLEAVRLCLAADQNGGSQAMSSCARFRL
jgi:hypothetical protein